MAEHTGPFLDLAHAGPDIIKNVLGSMSLRERFNCALVCKAWGEAATAATRSIILQYWLHPTGMQDLSSLQQWLEKHGNRLEVLQLHACDRTALTALPSCAKLQDLLLHSVSIASRTLADIASATKLTAISLSSVQTASQQEDVVAALAALPNLEQLTWHNVYCSNEVWPPQRLSDSSLLQHLTRLTSLDLEGVTAAALQHLGSLTKLQHFRVSAAESWAAAGCPGLQQLKALTSLELASRDIDDIPTSVSQLKALRQLGIRSATVTALNQLQVLTALTQLSVSQLMGLSPDSSPLKLPGLQHLQHHGYIGYIESNSFLASCTHLQVLKLKYYIHKGPGSLVASTSLQHLELYSCTITAADGAADPVSWQQVFPGPGQLPHLTSLQLHKEDPTLHQADIEAVVACCSNLKVLHLDTLQDSFVPALARAPRLTSLQLHDASDELCSAMVQLTGLRQLAVGSPGHLSAVGLRQLAALQQLTRLRFGRFPCSELDTLADHLMQDNLPHCWHALINKVGVDAPYTTAMACVTWL